MEYLTLQDIPHRHCDPLHSRRLTSSQRPLGNMAAANHHMRSSPPIQPGEHNVQGKLPSFSEFLYTTRATTPPRTPSRRPGSATGSPQLNPQFDNVVWTDSSKRRRTDTLGDIYDPPSTTSKGLPLNARRMSSAIDPALDDYRTPRPIHHRGVSDVHHRPPIPYARPAHPSGSLRTTFRPRSPPPPSQGHAVYAQQNPRQSIVTQNSYLHPAVQHDTVYEQRPGYYQEPPNAAYGYERARESFYTQPSYPGPPPPGYENPYSDIRFHQHVGLDQNAFNRKRRGNLPKEATNLLKEWFAANRSSPYPTEDQKHDLCHRTGLTLNQVSNWFINARRRAPQKEQREREANNADTS